ncbi:hypothetical protein [Reichenbachiella ulvae]|uniref:DUF4328 domain-containing protein n=1 Tax=Reichenbachiella ulvae TaxID=2980104 RepID=A0ABT3CQ72_9BACT|nr:hypothetical protein [Reichenbachiella ulvae]MCV9385851.1 hypothetical protein [Reichenbachiella ulvae]
MKKLSINRTPSISHIFILFLGSQLVLGLMFAFTFPVIHSQMGDRTFDLRTFGYSVKTAQSLVDKLDASTAQFYLFPQLFLLDLIYPFLLALFLYTFLLRLKNLTGLASQTWWLWIRVLPFVAMVFDYLENLGIAIMITHSGLLPPSLVRLTSAFTVTKGLFTTCSWIVALALCIAWFWQKIKSSNKRLDHKKIEV